MEHIYDTVIIGGGPGGYTAALYAVRAGLDTVLLEKMYPGGQMTQTHQIDNYPGFEKGIDGFSLSMKIQSGAERFGAKTEITEVTKAELSGDIKKIETTSGTYLARTVIIATGASPRELGVEGEYDRIGRGIHYCAACDGMFYKDKTVVVTGGGNTAASDALLLSRIAKKVILVHRRDTLKADKIYHEPLEKTENVELVWNNTVTELVINDDMLTGVKLKNTLNGELTELECDGVFVSIGRKPASELFGGQLRLNESGYIIADETTRTDIPGVYAVGDIRTKALRQIVTALADGATAAHFAEEYLAEISVK